MTYWHCEITQHDSWDKALRTAPTNLAGNVSRRLYTRRAAIPAGLFPPQCGLGSTETAHFQPLAIGLVEGSNLVGLLHTHLRSLSPATSLSQVGISPYPFPSSFRPSIQPWPRANKGEPLCFVWMMCVYIADMFNIVGLAVLSRRTMHAVRGSLVCCQIFEISFWVQNKKPLPGKEPHIVKT